MIRNIDIFSELSIGVDGAKPWNDELFHCIWSVQSIVGIKCYLRFLKMTTSPHALPDMVGNLGYIFGLRMGSKGFHYVPHLPVIVCPEAVAIIIIPGAAHELNSPGTLDGGEGPRISLWDHLMCITRHDDRVQVPLDKGWKVCVEVHYGFV